MARSTTVCAGVGPVDSTSAPKSGPTSGIRSKGCPCGRPSPSTAGVRVLRTA